MAVKLLHDYKFSLLSTLSAPAIHFIPPHTNLPHPDLRDLSYSRTLLPLPRHVYQAHLPLDAELDHAQSRRSSGSPWRKSRARYASFEIDLLTGVIEKVIESERIRSADAVDLKAIGAGY